MLQSLKSEQHYSLLSNDLFVYLMFYLIKNKAINRLVCHEKKSNNGAGIKPNNNGTVHLTAKIDKNEPN